MLMSRPTVLALFFALTLSAPAMSQSLVPPPSETVSLSGPRFGLTILTEGVVDKLAEYDVDVAPHITQFGWQFEKQFYSRKGGVAAVSEWVVLAGGLEQGVMIPSLSWLVGLRTREGAEFGIGPNITRAGAALALAAGMTFRAGALNVPVNVAVVPSRSGVRVSLLSGFSLRTR